MRRTSALEVTTTLCVLIGLVALAALGQSVAVAAIVAALLVVAAIPVRGLLPAGTPWGVFTLLGTAAGVGLPLALGTSLVEALSISLAVLQVLRRFARRAPGDDRTSVLLSMLMLVLASTASTSPWLGVAALTWAATAPLVAMLAYLQSAAPRGASERRTVGGHLRWMAVATLVVTVAGFFALPRFRPAAMGGQGSSDASIGFSDHVALGEIGTLLDDPTTVLRITMPPGAPDPRYVRGLVLDRFDGRRWSATVPDQPVPTTSRVGAIPIRVLQEAEAGAVAFAPGRIVAIDSDPPGFSPDTVGNWRLLGEPRRHTYVAWVVPVDSAPTPPSARWIELPTTLDTRIPRLANRIVGEVRDPVRAAAAIEAWLDENARYTYAPRDADVEAPLAAFLFDTRAGHCEYFATAAAVMLRATGHPARVVNGYASPEWNEVGGFWLVRAGNAHSWVEVQARDGRWHTVDPTPDGSRPPPATSLPTRIADAATRGWYQGILAYDGSVQIGLLRSAGWWVQTRVTGTNPRDATPWLGLLLLLGPVLAIAIATVLGLRRIGRRLAGERPTRPVGRVARLHARARGLVTRAGWRVPSSLPPVEAARWLAEDAPEAGADLEALAWLHYRVRYGGEDDAHLAAEARTRLAAFRSALPRRAEDAVGSASPPGPP